MTAVITVTGYAARDAEKKEAGDNNVTRISIPNKYKVRDEEKTDWFQIKVWGKQADYAEKIKKGFYVVAIGNLTTYQGEKGTYFEVNANSISFVKPAPKEEAPPPPAKKQQRPQYDEDVPW